MSDVARGMVEERGQEDWDSEFQRFPRLFEGHEAIPGLTYPTTTFSDSMTVYLGKRRVDIKHIGRAHTAGDAVIHVPDENVMFTGDIVEDHSACYCGDGSFRRLGADARQHHDVRRGRDRPRARRRTGRQETPSHGPLTARATLWTARTAPQPVWPRAVAA